MSRQNLVVGCVSLSLFISFYLSNVLSVAIPYLSQNYGTLPHMTTYVVSSYTIALACFLLPASILAKHYTNEKIFSLGLISCALVTLALPFSPNLIYLVVGRILQGACAALFLSTAMALISNHVSPKRRYAAVGISAGLTYAGIAVSLGLGGIAIESTGFKTMLDSAGVGLLLLALCARNIKAEEIPHNFEQIPFAKLCLFILSLGLFLISLAAITSHDLAKYGIAISALLFAILIYRDYQDGQRVLRYKAILKAQRDEDSSDSIAELFEDQSLKDQSLNCAEALGPVQKKINPYQARKQQRKESALNLSTGDLSAASYHAHGIARSYTQELSTNLFSLCFDAIKHSAKKIFSWHGDDSYPTPPTITMVNGQVVVNTDVEQDVDIAFASYTCPPTLVHMGHHYSLAFNNSNIERNQERSVYEIETLMLIKEHYAHASYGATTDSYPTVPTLVEMGKQVMLPDVEPFATARASEAAQLPISTLGVYPCPPTMEMNKVHPTAPIPTRDEIFSYHIDHYLEQASFDEADFVRAGGHVEQEESLIARPESEGLEQAILEDCYPVPATSIAANGDLVLRSSSDEVKQKLEQQHAAAYAKQHELKHHICLDHGDCYPVPTLVNGVHEMVMADSALDEAKNSAIPVLVSASSHCVLADGELIEQSHQYIEQNHIQHCVEEIGDTKQASANTHLYGAIPTLAAADTLASAPDLQDSGETTLASSAPSDVYPDVPTLVSVYAALGSHMETIGLAMPEILEQYNARVASTDLYPSPETLVVGVSSTLAAGDSFDECSLVADIEEQSALMAAPSSDLYPCPPVLVEGVQELVVSAPLVAPQEPHESLCHEIYAAPPVLGFDTVVGNTIGASARTLGQVATCVLDPLEVDAMMNQAEDTADLSLSDTYPCPPSLVGVGKQIALASAAVEIKEQHAFDVEQRFELALEHQVKAVEAAISRGDASTELTVPDSISCFNTANEPSYGMASGYSCPPCLTQVGDEIILSAVARRDSTIEELEEKEEEANEHIDIEAVAAEVIAERERLAKEQDAITTGERIIDGMPLADLKRIDLVRAKVEQRSNSVLFPIHLLLKNTAFAFCVLVSLACHISVMAEPVLLATFAQLSLGFSASTTGFMVMVQPLVVALVSFSMGRLTKYVNSYALMTIGLVLQSLTLASFLWVDSNSTLVSLMLRQIALGIGYGLFASPNTALVTLIVNREHLAQATSLQQLSRMVGYGISYALMIGMIGTMVSDMPGTLEYGFELMHAAKTTLACCAGFGLVATICAAISYYFAIQSRRKANKVKAKLSLA